MKKKPKRKTIVKKLDTIFSQFIRKRDKRCVVCGSRERLTCGHLFSRIAYSTRWDEVNAHCQCWGCNYRHEYDFYPYQKWFVNQYGEQKYEDLHKQFNTPKKFSNSDLEEMVILYKQKTNEME